MPIKLRPGEIAFYPQPFVESEPNLVVVTNQRVVQFGEAGHQEIPSRDVTHTGRISQRPLLLVGVLAALVGLPLLGTGLYFFFTAKGPLPGLPGLPGAAAPAPKPSVSDDPSQAPPGEGEEGGEEGEAPEADSGPLMGAGTQRIVGAGLGVLGLLLLAGSVLAIRQQKHYVLVRGGPLVMRIGTADKMQQTQILMVVQAAQQGARPAGGAPAPAAAAPAKPKVDVDDKGDPVKALQDLAMARQTGKVGDEEFQAKREVLLERIRARK